MGTCTSTTARHRQKQHNRNVGITKNSINFDTRTPPPLPPLPSNAFSQQSQSIYTDFDILSSVTRPIFHQTDTNSLIQLYSSNTNYNRNNNNNSNTNYMSSSTSTVTHIPPRIPVPKTRLPIPQIQQPAAVHLRPKSNIPTHQTVPTRPISMTNRAPPPTSMQTRFGFIPRPTAPGLQQYRSSTIASRSRSISPTSTISANSSSSSSIISQRVKPPSSTQIVPPSTTTKNVPKSTRDPSSSKRTTVQSPTTASQMRSRTPSTTSPTSSTISPESSSTLKTDINSIRDRYRSQKRMNFFARHTPISTANGSPVAHSVKSPQSTVKPAEKKTISPPISSNVTKRLQSKTPPSVTDSAYTSVNHPSSTTAHLSHSTKHRQRAISMLSTTSGISDVLNQDVLLQDENCSLKSDDLMCDYDETLTIDSVSKNDPTDSCSSVSLVADSSKKPISTVKTTKTANLRESLDELNRLNTRIDNNENEQTRKFSTRSVSLKAPTSYLPPLDDAEQITMDIESYRQVMKDVMIVKTVLHQLDRLLKHSDGANMTDSMIGSFHEYHENILNQRRFSTCTNDGNLRSSIDENSSYDDLLKEIIVLRKEKEQDKQTIKLLQEQMYKYSSQTNA